jgi:hypothetical protein
MKWLDDLIGKVFSIDGADTDPLVGRVDFQAGTGIELTKEIVVGSSTEPTTLEVTITATGEVAAADHAVEHEAGGDDEIDGGALAYVASPSGYTPSGDTIGGHFAGASTAIAANASAIAAHAAAADPHTGYALLAGRTGGQTLNGGIAASDALWFRATTHGTPGTIGFFDPVTIRSNSARPSGVVLQNISAASNVRWTRISTDSDGIGTIQTQDADGLNGNPIIQWERAADTVTATRAHTANGVVELAPSVVYTESAVTVASDVWEVDAPFPLLVDSAGDPVAVAAGEAYLFTIWFVVTSYATGGIGSAGDQVFTAVAKAFVARPAGAADALANSADASIIQMAQVDAGGPNLFTDLDLQIDLTGNEVHIQPTAEDVAWTMVNYEFNFQITASWQRVGCPALVAGGAPEA